MIGRGRKRRGYIRSIKGKTVQRFFPWKDRELKRISLSLSLIDQTERNRFDVCDNLTTWRYLDRRQFLIVLSRIYQRNFTDSLLSRSGFDICRISVEPPERLNFILRLIYIYIRILLLLQSARRFGIGQVIDQDSLVDHR